MPEPTDAALPPIQRLRALLGWSPSAFARLGGGRNSRVYRVTGATGECAALKVYFRHPGYPRDRMGTEFQALTFCWEEGLRRVPRPLAADPEHSFALYECIEGDRITTPGPAEVAEAVDFLLHLRDLSGRPTALGLPAASEACFSFQALEAGIRSRLAALDAAAPGALRGFLAGQLRPAWEALLAECQDQCRRYAIPFDGELPVRARILSPSDFGFHNALRRNGRLVFFDFEYFGWDDPAKTLSDLLLHPGMGLTLERRRQFAAGLLDGLAAVPELPLRTRLAFPLYGIKWCLILLNEFLPEALERRAFAARDGTAPEEGQARQLAKAQVKLTQLLDDHANFPYFQI
jgi:hypothetical protein